jgi:hypothetical protein
MTVSLYNYETVNKSIKNHDSGFPIVTHFITCNSAKSLTLRPQVLGHHIVPIGLVTQRGLELESLDGMNRNGWTEWIGIGGRNRPEYTGLPLR